MQSLFFTLFLLINISVSKPWASAATLTLSNNCPYSVWPGIQPGGGKPVVANGSLFLPPHQAQTLQLPPLWSGRVWARHGCTFDSAGHGQCATGDCGGNLFCNGLGGAPPATLAELSLGPNQDFYDVSFVDGYNLPITITPIASPGLGPSSGNCGSVGCSRDLNTVCPKGLQVRSRERVIACKSACMAFHSPNYCCTGSYASAQACGPTEYSRIFKKSCPRAYSYAFDDPSSLVTCSNANYLVTFCPN